MNNPTKDVFTGETFSTKKYGKDNVENNADNTAQHAVTCAHGFITCVFAVFNKQLYKKICQF